ncbi:hypothetical protein JZ751_009187, partial [Albula glossodonta]
SHASSLGCVRYPRQQIEDLHSLTRRTLLAGLITNIKASYWSAGARQKLSDMLGRKNKRAPMPKGQGAAAAKQMGLFMDFKPEEMMAEMDGDLDDPDLEAEFAAIVGHKAASGGRSKAKGKTPLPMEDIEKMAEECMKDIYDDDDEDLENDEDLLAELQEVVGEEEAEDEGIESPTCPVSVETSPAETPESPHQTLETMLTSVKKGRKVDEGEIPPPVACGGARAPPLQAMPQPQPAAAETAEQAQASSPETGPSSGASSVLATPALSSLTSPTEEHSSEETAQSHAGQEHSSEEAAQSPAGQEHSSEETAQSPAASESVGSEQQATRALLLGRQREYKLAALKAKQDGDLEGAKGLIKISKKFDTVIEALDSGQPVDLSGMPPPPHEVEAQGSTASPSPVRQPPPRPAPRPAPPVPATPAGPPQPKDVLEALEQRMAKYQEACAQAKANGDDRKARMHERIGKQYQSAIRAHKAGRPVNYDELPVPPGFPPIPGHAEVGAEQGFAAVLEAATKLASDEGQEAGEEDEEEEQSEEKRPPAPQMPKKPTLAVPPTQQLDFLEGRRKQYMKAALQAKQKNDMEQARNFLRAAKGFDPMIEAAKSGKPVDISKDFILVHHSDVHLSEKAEEVYSQLAKLLKEQYDKAMMYSKQFTHLGNIAETTKFEKMAESCKKNLEILKLSQAQGLDPPKHHFEERTYKTVRIFPDLSSTEMVVVIVKAMNLPAPHGEITAGKTRIATNDLDAFVKFEFPYPSTEQPQKHKTNVIKNTNCPEYNQSFTLTINRNHRGFRRIIQSKGIKLEVLHKGGFLRSDKPVGTAHLKLEKLETESEVREIVEVIDGRKPTGGRVEIRARLREPLSGHASKQNTFSKVTGHQRRAVRERERETILEVDMLLAGVPQVLAVV